MANSPACVEDLCKCLCRLVNALASLMTTFLSLLLFQAVLDLGV